MKRTNVMNEEWDVLIILDACRYDTFCDLMGDSEFILSVGSSTGEWVKKTFTRKLEGTTYISANPHIGYALLPTLIDIIPCPIIEAWKDWDETLQTVLPENVTKHIPNPHDKLVLHYMQPHHPFIAGKVRAGGFTQFRGGQPENKTVWQKLEDGEMKREQAYEDYKDTLAYIIKHIYEEALPKLTGKVMITSDHGNCFGEHDVLGHPSGLNHLELIKVPWYEVER